MPRKYLMSWEGSPAYRWVKMYRGKRHRVSCDDLRAPRTKEGSYQAANDWWRRRLAELTVRQPEPERQELLDAIQKKLDWAANHTTHPEVVQRLEATQRQIFEEPPGELVLADAETIRQNIETARLMGVVVPDDLDPTISQHLFGDRRLWQERLANHDATDANKTVGHQLERFLAELRHQQKPQTHYEMALYLRRLGLPVWATQAAVDSIDEQTVSKHYAWLVEQNYGHQSHNKRLGYFRRFVRWLYTSGLISKEPLNLHERSHRKKKIHKPIKRHNGVKSVVDGLARPYKLWVLLCLNCGCTQADLGRLSWDADIDGYPQIDTATWILTRRRAKTGDQPQTPTVRYKLWPETIAELERLPHRTGLLFATSTGKPMYETFYRNGQACKKDLFSDDWKEILPKPPISLGKFRSVAATALKADTPYRGFVDYFLAHSPKTLADAHYAAEHDAAFFEALEFIRKQLGFGGGC